MGYLMQMDTRRRILRTLTLAALCCVLAAASVTAAGAQESVRQSEVAALIGKASSAGQASVKVRACRSSAYYAERDVEFRLRMYRLNVAGPQELQIKVEAWRKLKEDNKYRRLKIPGLSAPTTAKDPAAMIYQRDVAIKNVETAAHYRARAIFQWRNPDTGALLAKKVVRSKSCRQKLPLPHLRIKQIRSLPIAGMRSIAHTITVVNSGRSEALAVPVAVVVDGGTPVFASIESIGPRQVKDVTIDAPVCTAAAYAQLDPLRTLVRLRGAMRTPLPLERCS